MNGEILAILELSVASKIRDMKFCSVLKPIKTLPFVTLPASQPQALAGGYDCDGQITAGPAKHVRTYVLQLHFNTQTTKLYQILRSLGQKEGSDAEQQRNKYEGKITRENATMSKF